MARPHVRLGLRSNVTRNLDTCAERREWYRARYYEKACLIFSS